MKSVFYEVPMAKNEPILSCNPQTAENENIIKALKDARSQVIDIPMIINGEEIYTDKKISIAPPHDHQHKIGEYSMGDESHVKKAIQAALDAKENWENMDWRDRAAIFLKAAALISGPYRAKINAATMLAQSKTVFQAEIDAVCELADFLRFNVQYMNEIYNTKPDDDVNAWNRLEQRPLEGFIFALTPFNFTAIAGNLPSAPAMLGNTVVWKASGTQIYSAKVIMDIFREAGLPDGVINLVFVPGPVAGEIIFEHPDFAGIHFTGSTEVFQNIWSTIGGNIRKYKTYPRIVGETGGKDFIMVHKTANAIQVATAIARGAFEYQGQKCSAASRAYIPSNLWQEVKELTLTQVESMKMGGVEDQSNFLSAVIDEKSFDNIVSYIEYAKNSNEAEIIQGGGYDKTVGYFIEPTIVVTTNPNFKTMEEEIFGPVITIYVYGEDKFEETLDLVDSTSAYALTGSILGTDRAALALGTKKLRHAAGNFYINDKPSGAVVGQQPFGGSRASGTNDKAGSDLNLLRWLSPRTIKENLLPPTNYRYPFMD